MQPFGAGVRLFICRVTDICHLTYREVGREVLLSLSSDAANSANLTNTADTMTQHDPLPLAPRDLLILSVLAEGPHHGYGIIKAVEARSESGVLLDPANLYRVLRRMRRLDWIREAAPGGPEKGGSGLEAIEAGETRAGPDARRRTYEITPAGRILLASELARLERLLNQVRPALARRGSR